MVKDSIWDSKLVERLKELYLERDMSTVSIAKALGVTKNSIIGKIHRLRLNELKEVKGLEDKPISNVIIKTPEKKAVVAKGQHKLSDIEFNMCVWPYGEDEFTFCGQETVVGKSYCKEHLDLVYLTSKKVSKKKYAAIDEHVGEEEEDIEEIEEEIVV